MADGSLRPRGRRAVVAAVAGYGAALSAPAGGLRAAVVHQYSFSTDGSANDTVGGVDATLANGATVSGGQLNTAGGGSGAAGTNPGANLPAGAVAGLTGDFAVEQFFTRGATANGFPTLFSFAAGATDTNNYVIATPSRGTTNVPSVAYKQAGVNGGAEVVLTGGTVALNASAYVATTFQSATGTATFFLNGAPASQSAALTGFNLSTKGTKAGIGGQGPFADPGFIGTTAEFRISNDAVTGRQVALNYLAGPDNAVAVPTNASTATGDYNGGAFATAPAAGDDVVVAGGTTVTLSSGTGSAGLLEVAGGGTLTVAGGTLAPTTSLNVASGGTVNVNAGGMLAARGILADGSAAGTADGTRALNLNGGTVQAASSFVASGGITANVTADSTIDTNGATGTGVQFNAALTGSARLTKAGAGVLVLGGNATAFTGPLTVAAGQLTLAPPAARTTAGGSPLANPVSFSPTAAGNLTVVQTNAVDLTGGIALPAPAAATTYGLSATGTPNNNLNVSGVVTGGGANSTLSLTGFFKYGNPANAYAGNTSLNGSTSVQLTTPKAFGNSTVVFNNGGFETTTALTGANAIPNAYAFGGTPAAFFNGTVATEMTGPGTLSTAATTFAVAQPTATLSGVLSGTGALNKTGTGTLVLSGDNTFTGNLTFPTGTAVSGAIRLASNNAAGLGAKTITLPGDNGAIQTLELTGNITVNNLTFNTSGRNASPVNLRNVSGNNVFGGAYNISGSGGAYAIESLVGKLTLNGPAANNVASSTRVIQLLGAGDGELAGVVSNGLAVTAGVTGISKPTGAGTWILSNANNTYTGTTTVSAGLLLVTGKIVSATSATAGGTLGGTGTVAAAVTTAAGSTLAPGVGGIGTFTVDSAAAAGTLAVEYNGVAAGTIDQLAVTNNLNITGGTLALTQVAGGQPLDDPAYVLATYGSLTGTAFATVTGLPAGYEVNTAYNGNSIALVAVPEPTAAGVALLGVAAPGLLARRRRRRRNG